MLGVAGIEQVEVKNVTLKPLYASAPGTLSFPSCIYASVPPYLLKNQASLLYILKLFIKDTILLLRSLI
jgi:hypothetical protein